MILFFTVMGGYILLAPIGGYLIGSIPFGIVITRALGLGDLRQIGSGNIGATNVLRTGNKGAALATLVLDSGKGGIAVLLAATLLEPGLAPIAGLFAFIGHCYPVWLKFRGGKGIATLLGIILALNFWAGLAACATWAVVAALTRTSSLAGMIAAISAPWWLAVIGRTDAVLVACILAALALWRHRSNIARIMAGTEPKIGNR